MSVCVVGAGIIGLSTAVEIQKKEPRAKVTLVADKFTPELTSDIAAGLWRPIYMKDPREELIKKWAEQTFEYTVGLASENAVRYGASFASGYDFSMNNNEDPYWKDIVRDFHVISQKQKYNMGYEQFPHGISYTSTFLESSTYLPFLHNVFEKNGGVCVKKRLESLTELSADFDCIVNCTGVGAYSLVNDKEVYPIRGQVYRVDAPFIQHFYIFEAPEHDSYILPNQNSVVVGGTHQEGDWSTEISASDSAKIWREACRLVPSLKAGKILKQTVGLRPGRESVRLERCSMQICGRPAAVVHNYGHGGSGLALFHGCARHAACLAVEAVHKPRAKL